MSLSGDALSDQDLSDQELSNEALDKLVMAHHLYIALRALTEEDRGDIDGFGDESDLPSDVRSQDERASFEKRVLATVETAKPDNDFGKSYSIVAIVSDAVRTSTYLAGVVMLGPLCLDYVDFVPAVVACLREKLSGRRVGFRGFITMTVAVEKWRTEQLFPDTAT